MSGMWELPLSPWRLRQQDKPLLTLRHAIMQTNYRVAVFSFPGQDSRSPNHSHPEAGST
jgi:hypothetical protein